MPRPRLPHDPSGGASLATAGRTIDDGPDQAIRSKLDLPFSVPSCIVTVTLTTTYHQQRVRVVQGGARHSTTRR